MEEIVEVVNGEVVDNNNTFETVNEDNYLVSFKFGPIVLNIGLINSNLNSYFKFNIDKVINGVKSLFGFNTVVAEQ